MTMLTREQILTAITHYYEKGDFSFINTVQNIAFGYKQDLKARSRLQPNQLDHYEKETV